MEKSGVDVLGLKPKRNTERRNAGVGRGKKKDAFLCVIQFVCFCHVCENQGVVLRAVVEERK